METLAQHYAKLLSERTINTSVLIEESVKAEYYDVDIKNENLRSIGAEHACTELVLGMNKNLRCNMLFSSTNHTKIDVNAINRRKAHGRRFNNAWQIHIYNGCIVTQRNDAVFTLLKCRTKG